jgi:hypothetical protein
MDDAVGSKAERRLRARKVGSQTLGFAANLGEIGPVHGKLKRHCVGLAAAARLVARPMAGTVMRDEHWWPSGFLVSSSSA